jgi:hypothetical protein
MSRQKIVLSHEQVFHAWAVQNPAQPIGKNAKGSVSFAGPVLASYGHYPIGNLTGRRIPGARGRTLALIQSRDYSATTRGHIYRAMGALDARRYVAVRVPEIQPDGPADHTENCASLTRIALDAWRSITRARRVAAMYAQDYERAVEAGRVYRAAFGLSLKGRPALPHNWKAVKRAAQRQTLKARREAERGRQERHAEYTRQAAGRAAAWRDGQAVAYPFGFPVQLRIKPGAPDTVETSRGAEIPLEHARRIWPTVRRIKAGLRKPFKANGRTIKAGLFTIERITRQGTIEAGCHTITFEAVAGFAYRAGFETSLSQLAGQPAERQP